MAPSEGPSTPMASSNDEDKGPAVLASTLSVVILATLFVLARLYARGRMLKRLFLDDFFVILALMCAWIAVAFQIVAVQHGFGRHLFSLTASQRTLAIKYNTIAYVPGILSLGVPKLAVVALLTRVFANTASRWHRMFLWLMVICCNVLLALTAIFVLVQCRPLSMLWDPSATGVCWNRDVQIRFSMSASVVSAAVDLYLAVYPTIVVAVLRISRIRKFMISFALGCGFISAAIAAYKTTLIPKLASQDMTYAVTGLSIWTIVEGCVITIATTIPVLQPLVYKLFGENALSSRGPENGHPHRRHRERLGDRSDSTRLAPRRFNDSAVYMGRAFPNTKASTIVTGPAESDETSASYDKDRQSDASSQAPVIPGRALYLPPTSLSRSGMTSAHCPEFPPKASDVELAEMTHTIVRTDEIGVDFEEGAPPHSQLRTDQQ